MAYYQRYPRYVSVAQKQAKAVRKLKQLRKKNPHIQPIILEGQTLAKSWWGKAWNGNLENYADYANRIGRGRSYLRHRAVLDLQIAPGAVMSQVMGSLSIPYEVNIEIKALSAPIWSRMKTACADKFDSLKDLLAGRFPKSLENVFTAPGEGLFPSPEDITFDCSCPDWAYMCKHVAATLYGIGARLDHDPSLFFKLRGVSMTDLVSETMAEATGKLIEKADRKSDRVIADSDLETLFGIDLAAPGDPVPTAVVRNSAKKNKKKVAGKSAKKAAKTARSSRLKPKPELKGDAKIAKTRPRLPKTGSDKQTMILNLVNQTPLGMTVPELREKTGFSTSNIRTVIYKSLRQGLIERIARGVFRGKQRNKTSREQIETIVQFICEQPTGVAMADIKTHTGIAAPRIRYLISRAHTQGLIERVDRGIYAAPRPKRKKGKMNQDILTIIGRYKNGIAFTDLQEKSGFSATRLRNIIYRFSKEKKIRYGSRGIYLS